MIVRNLMDKEVLETTYRAHGGGVAQMILDRRVLKEIGFFASATLGKGKELEAHIDPMEEIYFIMSGEGEMTVGDDTQHVVPGDAIWIPAGSSHSLLNTGESDIFILAWEGLDVESERWFRLLTSESYTCGLKAGIPGTVIRDSQFSAGFSCPFLAK